MNQSHSCFCIGPQDGSGLCPCQQIGRTFVVSDKPLQQEPNILEILDKLKEEGPPSDDPSQPKQLEFVF